MYKSLIVVCLSSVIMSACSGDSVDKVQQDHVWKEQTDMIDKAKNVENLLQDAAALQQQKINEQTH